MPLTETPAFDIDALRDRCAGDVVAPADAQWDLARQAWNLAVDQRPVAVALPETVDDVVAVVEAARAHGLRVAAQATGHSAGAFSDLDDTILLKTSRLTGVEIDAEARRARVGAGALWLDVTAPASELGLAPLAGSSPDVGVAGYTLGGGLSWLARTHGLAANGVLGVELVTADGRRLCVDADNEPELFWALRGGGGSFGVVTALEIPLHPVSDLTAGALLWPWERAGEVLRAWAAWAADAPDAVTSAARLLQLPPLPDIPENLRGRSLVVVDAAILAAPDAAAELLAPLRALDPEIDLFGPVPPVALSRIHMDPEQPVPGLTDHLLLREAPAEAIDALVAAFGPGSGSPLLQLELRQLGGALARPSAGQGALGTLDAGFLLAGVGIPVDQAAAAAIETALRRIHDTAAPWRAERGYLGFADRPCDPATLFAPDAYARLRAVKAEWDPEDVIRANHPIPAA